MMFSSTKVIGLDIGTSSIKMAELSVSKRGAQLISFGFATTPENAVTNGEISNTNVISSTVKAVLAEIGSRRRNFAVALGGPSVVVKKITIPKIDKKIVGDQIRWEAEQYIPFDLTDVGLAYHILPKKSDETMDVLIIAAQNRLILQQSAVASQVGGASSVVDVAGFALANCFELNYGKRKNEVIGLLNIGAATTNFVVVQDGEVIFCRDIPLGGMYYTHAIHKEMGVTFGEAEALKLSATNRREVPDEVHSIISAATESMSEEMRNSFEFFSATTSGAVQIKKVFLSGGCSTIPGLMDSLTATIGLPFEYFNPFQRIKGSSQFSSEYLRQIAPFAGVVCGLALREVGDT